MSEAPASPGADCSPGGLLPGRLAPGMASAVAFPIILAFRGAAMAGCKGSEPGLAPFGKH